MPSLRGNLLQLAQRATRHAGVEIIPTWRLEHFPQAAYLRKLFAHYAISAVVDVGANRGQYHDFLRHEVGFAGRIISVEPLPDLVADMRARAAQDPLWTVECLALGASSGTASFNRMAGSEFSSFLTPRHAEAHSFAAQNTVRETVSVTVDTLDALVRRLGMTDTRLYLKLDTQGFDLEVLRGAGDALRAVYALQSEVSVRPIYSDQPPFDESIRAIESMGFTLSGVFPNNADHFPLLIELDCHFVRQV
jgi:FkbM family methyltransferase